MFNENRTNHRFSNFQHSESCVLSKKIKRSSLMLSPLSLDQVLKTTRLHISLGNRITVHWFAHVVPIFIDKLSLTASYILRHERLDSSLFSEIHLILLTATDVRSVYLKPGFLRRTCSG